MCVYVILFVALQDIQDERRLRNGQWGGGGGVREDRETENDSRRKGETESRSQLNRCVLSEFEKKKKK